MFNIYLPLYIFVFAFTLLTTAFLVYLLIPVLKGKAKQPIYEEGPSWHISKKGTPTMGGLAFLLAIGITLTSLSLVFIFILEERRLGYSLLISSLFAISNSLIGFFDDYTKLKKNQNAGLTPKQKLALQFLVSVIYLFARWLYLHDDTAVTTPTATIDLSLLYYPFAILMLLGIVNCANLTDGIDGLASGVAFSIGVVFFYVCSRAYPDSAIIASSLMGGGVAFLFFNLKPAKIFMGDTGSLFFGALVASIAFSIDNPIALIFVGGVYVIEGLSVILQVLVYKRTGKRILKMAPIHHHLEKCGLDENTIVVIAIITTFVLSIAFSPIYL